MAQESQNVEISSICDDGKLDKNMAEFFMNERFSDIKFLIGDEKICAHRVVLAARSDYFNSILLDSREIRIDVPLQAFAEVLKYIYLGTLSIPPDEKMVQDILKLARKFSLESLETLVTEQMCAFLDSLNVCQALNTANLYNLQELKEKCLSFIDQNLAEILKNHTFSSLSQASMVTLLERDDFPLPEVEVLKVVERWCKANNDKNNLVKNCIRLTCFTVDEIIKTVWPSKLIEETKLFTALSQLRDDNFKNNRQRKNSKGQSLSTTVQVSSKVNSKASENLGLSEGYLRRVLNKNVASSYYGAQVVAGKNPNYLLSGETAMNQCAYHAIKDNASIIVKLNRPYWLNHISMRLYDLDPCFYSYYIEISRDGQSWVKVIDYNCFPCRSFQNLYFNQAPAQFIKIVGTKSSLDNKFKLMSFKAFLKEDIPLVVNGIIRPKNNVATLDNGAVCSQRFGLRNILNRNSNGHTYHMIGEGIIVIQLAQPYLISSVKVRLHPFTKYHIATSTDNTHWESVIFKAGDFHTSLQEDTFLERPVSFIAIVGTFNGDLIPVFSCSHFECSSK